MTKNKYIILGLLILSCTIKTNGQISTNELPYSFSLGTYEVEVSFSKNDEKCNMLFRIEGCTTNDNTMCYKDTLGYRINVYRLDPYPGETETFLIDSADYKIKLKVQKL